ncbi:MAG: acyl-CoA dehydrogenase family protein, partial [Halieaceae bacterium]|nr:acyl-CoA dehydrogenase family protein [Halieaceae bacterium]
MNFDPSPLAAQYAERLKAFMDEHVYPVEHDYYDYVDSADNRWATVPLMEELKAKAREAGLWNLFIPKDHGGELSNLDYAPLAEIMGRVLWSPEIFNCNAPDTGNMEVFMKYGT